MAKPYRVTELEQQFGDLHKIIPPLVNEVGQAETARRLGVSQATISVWLKANHYESKTVYERPEIEVAS